MSPKPVPKYTYYCVACDSHFDTSHSLQESYTICKNCGEDGNITRKPSEIFIGNKNNKSGSSHKVGEVVEAAIETSRKELNQEQHILKNRVYKK